MGYSDACFARLQRSRVNLSSPASFRFLLHRSYAPRASSSLAASPPRIVQTSDRLASPLRCISRRDRLASPKRDGFRTKRHRALAYCLRMISAQTLRVCREGKPLHTFPDHALTARNNATRDRIMSDAFERFRFSFFEDQNSARDGLDLSSLAQLSDDERVRAEH